MVSVAPPRSALNTSRRSPRGANAWESKPQRTDQRHRGNGVVMINRQPAPVAQVSGREVGPLDAQLPQYAKDPLVNGSFCLCRHHVLPAETATPFATCLPLTVPLP